MDMPKEITIRLADYGEINVDTIDGIYNEKIHEAIAIAFSENMMNLVNIDCEGCNGLTKTALDYLIDDIFHDFASMLFSIEFRPTEDKMVQAAVEDSYGRYYQSMHKGFNNMQVITLDPSMFT